MRFWTPLLLAGLCLGVTPNLRAAADTPVQVSLTKPQTPPAEVLADLSKQTGTPLLADDTLTTPFPPGDFQAPGLDQMLTTLKGLDAGLAWRKVYLPKDAPLPTGPALALQVRALQTVTTGLVLPDPAGNVSAARGPAAAPPPAGMRLVYLVMDEAVYAKRQAAAATADGTPVTKTTQGMQSVADTFGKMTAEEQRQSLPVMFQQFQRILQGMDPGVRDGLRQQFGGGGPGFGGGPPPGFGGGPPPGFPQGGAP